MSALLLADLFVDHFGDTVTIRSIPFYRSFAGKHPIDTLLAAVLLSLGPFYRVLHRALRLHMKRNGGRIPMRYFETLPQLVAQASYELLVIEEREDGEHIYLAQRPAHDPYWAGEWHFPGTTMYPGDSFERMLNRLLNNELGGQIDPERIEIEFVHLTSPEERARGGGMHIVCSVIYGEGELDIDAIRETSDVPVGFFPINQLPTPMITHHANMLAQRVRREYTDTVPLNNGQ